MSLARWASAGRVWRAKQALLPLSRRVSCVLRVRSVRMPPLLVKTVRLAMLLLWLGCLPVRRVFLAQRRLLVLCVSHVVLALLPPNFKTAVCCVLEARMLVWKGKRRVRLSVKLVPSVQRKAWWSPSLVRRVSKALTVHRGPLLVLIVFLFIRLYKQVKAACQKKKCQKKK